MSVKPSAFAEAGLRAAVAALEDEVRALYRVDDVPWVVGYSGGKDSTATLQLVWQSLAGLDPSERHKPVHVISTDTLVENPVVAAWVTRSLDVMAAAAAEQGLPVEPHRLTPEVSDTFWVNLIGKGYPAPRPKFRWCTERLKIKPSNAFIRSVVRAHGEAILVLGTRKAESQGRAGRMASLEARRVRDKLSPNVSLPNSLVYSPIEDWSNDDVWLYLMQNPNPWGFDNKDLLTMYQGASADGECPLVVDTTTPSCGDSRFGCWVCTLVDQDKSMQAMITNDDEKEWMIPLLDLRNALDVADDRPLRDFRRMNGAVQLFHGRPIPGPYTQEARENWLRRVLEAQEQVRSLGPPEVAGIELITLPELAEIRRIWVVDKHEFEDRLPAIFRDVTGQDFPGDAFDDHLPFGPDEIADLAEVCGDDRLQFEMVRELLDVERRHRAQVRRTGVFDALEEGIRRAFYTGEEDATERARWRAETVANAGGAGGLDDGWVESGEVPAGAAEPLQ
ncbi:MAG TPA: DNA phosphorothioation system sulfurtransferase DndC [Frankiaceae bacterium]|jgi:DNA sulfur modification protein DndC|nr:DNA phosphorothioation system sulfurtransferase DndC [Frankiaceae bacterium]